MPDGAVVPAVARVYAMLIESDSLHSDSAVVSDDHTLDLHIADSINLFQVRVSSFTRSFVSCRLG